MNVVLADSVFSSNSQLAYNGGRRRTDRPKFDIYYRLFVLPNTDLDLSLDLSI
jgi:hypothetical protein